MLFSGGRARRTICPSERCLLARSAATLRHVLALSDLSPHHKDPFDRLLVAQALVDDAHLVTADEALSQYPAPLFW